MRDRNLLSTSPFPDIRSVELRPDDAPLLQRFFDENPAYFLATTGQPAGPQEGLEEITSQVPRDRPTGARRIS